MALSVCGSGAACRAQPPAGQPRQVLRIAKAFAPFSDRLTAEYRRGLPNLDIQSQSAADSDAVIDAIQNGAADIGVVLAAVAYSAYWDFRNQTPPSRTMTRGLSLLQPLPAYVLVRANSGINQVADLRGRAVGVGPVNSSSWILGHIVLKAFGVEPRAIKVIGTREEGFDPLVVAIDPPRDLPTVRADRTALGLMLNNLVDNAIRYSKETRHLTIAARHSGASVIMEVRDKGIGIPESEISRVTRKFFRGRNSIAGGSGLGLAIELTHRDFELLQYLAKRPNSIVRRDELLRAIWGYPDTANTRAVDHAIVRLRKKIEATPHRPRFIHTVHGDGYYLTPDGQDTREE